MATSSIAKADVRAVVTDSDAGETSVTTTKHDVPNHERNKNNNLQHVEMAALTTWTDRCQHPDKVSKLFSVRLIYRKAHKSTPQVLNKAKHSINSYKTQFKNSHKSPHHLLPVSSYHKSSSVPFDSRHFSSFSPITRLQQTRCPFIR